MLVISETIDFTLNKDKHEIQPTSIMQINYFYFQIYKEM